MRASYTLPGRSTSASYGGMGNDAGSLLLIVCVWLIATVLINAVGDFPANDDWVYGASVEALLRDGRFSLPSPASANVVLQVYWGALFCLPFGFSYDALRVSTGVLAVAGLFALYASVREAGGSRRLALVATLVLELNPLWLQLGNTFMTDVPFTALTAVALWQFARWARTDDTRSLTAAFAIALATILLRQFALVFVAGFGVALAIRSRFSAKSLAVCLGAVALGTAAHLFYQHWLIASGRTVAVVGTSLHEVIPDPGPRAAARVLANILRLMPYLGLMTAPIYLAAGGGKAWEGLRSGHRSTLLAVAAVFALELAATAKQIGHMPYLGNVLNRWGLGPLTLRDTFVFQDNLPAMPAATAPLWTMALVLGISFGAVLAVDLVFVALRTLAAMRTRTLSHADTIAAGALGAVALYALIISVVALKLQWFDRYLLVLVPPLALLIVVGRPSAPPPRRATGYAALLVGLSAVFGIAASHDYFSWQRARLVATDTLRARGVPPCAIDGGYEFNGRYLYRADYRITPDKTYWWVMDDRYIIASGPLPGYVVEQRFGFASWLPSGPRQVVILRRAG